MGSTRRSMLRRHSPDYLSRHERLRTHNRTRGLGVWAIFHYLPTLVDKIQYVPTYARPEIEICLCSVPGDAARRYLKGAKNTCQHMRMPVFHGCNPQQERGTCISACGSGKGESTRKLFQDSWRTRISNYHVDYIIELEQSD